MTVCLSRHQIWAPNSLKSIRYCYFMLINWQRPQNLAAVFTQKAGAAAWLIYGLIVAQIWQAAVDRQRAICGAGLTCLVQLCHLGLILLNPIVSSIIFIPLRVCLGSSTSVTERVAFITLFLTSVSFSGASNHFISKNLPWQWSLIGESTLL